MMHGALGKPKRSADVGETHSLGMITQQIDQLDTFCQGSELHSQPSFHIKKRCFKFIISFSVVKFFPLDPFPITLDGPSSDEPFASSFGAALLDTSSSVSLYITVLLDCNTQIGYFPTTSG
jgi:hypothetical protein